MLCDFLLGISKQHTETKERAVDETEIKDAAESQARPQAGSRASSRENPHVDYNKQTIGFVRRI